MAAVWTAEITVLDRSARRIHIRATRTEGEDVRTYTHNAVIDPEDVAGSKAAAAQAIRDQYLADVAFAAQIAGAEADLKQWLEGQEA